MENENRHRAALRSGWSPWARVSPSPALAGNSGAAIYRRQPARPRGRRIGELTAEEYAQAPVVFVFVVVVVIAVVLILAGF